MKGPITAALTLLALLSVAVDSTDAAGVFSKASKFASLLRSGATNVPSGEYLVQNAQSKKWLAFSRSRGVPDAVLSKNPTVINFRNLGQKRVVMNLDRYCLSQQWNANRGINQADTLYRCCVSAHGLCDNGSDEGPLRNIKQHHYFVPAKSSAIRLASAAVSKRDLAEEEELVDERDFVEYNEAEDNVVLDKRASKKKKKFMGTFNIIALDHLHDMKTQAVSGKTMVAAGRQISPTLPILKAGDKSQQWNVYRLV